MSRRTLEVRVGRTSHRATRSAEVCTARERDSEAKLAGAGDRPLNRFLGHRDAGVHERTSFERPVSMVEVVRVIDDHCAIVLAPADVHVQPGDELQVAKR